MADFKDHIEDLIVKEGGYKLINVEHDRGGQTYAGISRKFNPDWEGWSFIDRGKTPPKAMVWLFYKHKYWDTCRLDEVESEDVAEVIFSSSVLSGHAVASRLAQASAIVKVDGHIGPLSLAEINAINPEVFELRFALARIARFSGIVQRNKSQRKFFLGWTRRVLNEL